MSEFGTNDASHELIPLYMYALTLPTKQTIKSTQGDSSITYLTDMVSDVDDTSVALVCNT